MRTIALAAVLVIAGVCEHPVAAQSNLAKLEQGAWVCGGAVALGVYDYFGYNLTRNSPTANTFYRATFYMAQGAITYLLYKKFGLPSAIGFNLIWWTFGVDMVFYGVSEVNRNTGGSWSAKGSWADDSQDGIKHAYFTPVGILRGVRRDNPIAANTIIAQAIAGGVIGISISIAF